MRKTSLEKYRKLLLSRRKDLLKEMGLLESNISTTIKESTGDLSSYSYHMADQGTDAMEREMTFMLASKSGRLLYHIDEALRRVNDGSYGKCFTCGKQIQIGRLEAV
ncbi:MAG: TraR/DksA family transcriptional regulator, partial [Candidatus Zixiibacteriota bacterium]